MTKEYCFDINGHKLEVGSSLRDCYLGVTVKELPICRVCKEEFLDTEHYELKCKCFGDIPEELEEIRSLSCPQFNPDKEDDLYEVVLKMMEKEHGQG